MTPAFFIQLRLVVVAFMTPFVSLLGFGGVCGADVRSIQISFDQEDVVHVRSSERRVPGFLVGILT